jgi:transposase
MDANTVLALGLGVTPPWRLVGQRLDTSKQPHELHLEVAADRGSLFPCPVCGKPCKAHDFAEFTWRHLNFFQHHCYITAKVPRTDCPEHGVLRITVPWAREGSRFTLLFEQAALMLVREMPVLAAARIIEITDQRLWRIVTHYVGKAVERLDLSKLAAVGLDETAAKRGQNYVTVFIDIDRGDKPVVFVTPGRGKETVARFKAFLTEHGGSPGRIAEVVCDMSGAFIAAIGENFETATVTVDWFHVVQLFTKAVDEVRRAEVKRSKLPKALRWAVLKRLGRTRGIRSVHGCRLAHQGEAPLGAPGAINSGRTLADHQLPAPRQRTARSRSHPRSGSQSPRDRRGPQHPDPAALDVIP